MKKIVKGNFYFNTYLLGNKELKSSLSINPENQEFKSNSTIQLKNTDKDLILPKIHLNINENIIKNDNSTIAKELEIKINHLAKLYEVESYKNKFSNKATFNILCPLNCSEKFKKESYRGNSLKINNMLNPYDHSEYLPDSKKHNMVKDHFKKHSEELLRFKHLGRNENSKVK